MPLLDHFRPPLAPRRHWESFHVNWAGASANALNESLGTAFALRADTDLYAIAYRPIVRDQQERIEVWTSPLEIGAVLPVLPLALDAEQCLPIDLESTYTAACQRRRLA